MSSFSPPRELVAALETVTEDALFGIAAAREDHEDLLTGLGKRRVDVYEGVVRGKERVPLTSFRQWMTELVAAVAPMRAPAWMPMAELVSGGVTVEGGARGVRSFFT